ncbi:MAG: GFA family protein [Nannocystaceae bacterium]|nr:GFA family protein [Nannocystaceae bacterium]
MAHCHCRDCQRLTGTAHSTGAMFAVSDVTLTGRTAEFELEGGSGATVTRTFCPTCGSPIFGKNTGMRGFITLSLGTFDDLESLVPQVAVFARSKPSWDAMDPAVESYDTMPDWSPENGT